MNTPLTDPDAVLYRILQYVDDIFTFLFLLEATLKIVALGFCYNNFPGVQPYILNAWNILDFIVVVSSLVDFGFAASPSGADTGSLKSLKALRAIRALRPLRMVSRNEGLRIVVNALFASIPAMTNVLLV